MRAGACGVNHWEKADELPMAIRLDLSVLGAAAVKPACINRNYSPF